MKTQSSTLGIWLAQTARVLGVALLLANVGLWFHPELGHLVAETYSDVNVSFFTLTMKNRILGCFISSLQVAVLTFALYTVSGIFQDFGKGQWFAERFSKKLTWFGIALLFFSILTPFVQVLTGFALTYSNPEEQRLMVVSVNMDFKGLIILCVGILLILLGKVMVKATQIADDNCQII